MGLRFLTAGESHGPALTVIVEGLPAGVAIARDAIDRQLRRRMSGYGRGGRMQIEKDAVEILGGVRFGRTIGSPVSLLVRNLDHVNWRDAMSSDGPHPGAELVDDHPQGVEVGALIGLPAQDLLWAHVLGSAQLGKGSGDSRGPPHLGQAEVHHLHVVVVTHHDVGGFDVPVHHPGGVRGLEGRGGLAGYLEGPRQRKLPRLLDDLRQRLGPYELHGDVDDALVLCHLVLYQLRV